MSQVCLRSGHKWLWHSPDVIVCESTVTAALKEASVKWHASYRQLTLSFGCIQYCFLVLFEARQKLLHVSWTVISWKYLVKSSVQTAEQLVFDIFLVYFLNRFLNRVILAVIWTECHGTLCTHFTECLFVRCGCSDRRWLYTSVNQPLKPACFSSAA